MVALGGGGGGMKMVTLHPHTSKHNSIRGNWSHTDTSVLVVGYGANYMATVQSGIQTSDL
jgi:hypothetical protein